MRGAFAMGLLGALLTLAGCGEKSSYDPWAGDRQTANPPPTPPDCPDLPELKNITREDGSIIDVRIIQIDDVKLYVPRSWMGNLNYAEDVRFYTKIPSEGGPFGRYDPDISDVECPGVVHEWVSNRAIFDLRFNFVVRRSNAEPWILPNFTLDTKIDSLSIARPRAVTDPRLLNERTFRDDIIDWPTDRTTSAHIVVVPDHLTATYGWPKAKPVGSHEWNAARADVIDLVNWLRTPPNRRDNDGIFELGVR